MTETIFHQGQLLAIVIPATIQPEGTAFFTPPACSLQIGTMNRRKGYCVPAHTHRIQARQLTQYQEVLVVRKGSIKVDLYTTNNEFAASRVLTEGDCILLAGGGHAVEVLCDAEVLEIKQGPFAGDDDKVFLTPLPNT